MEYKHIQKNIATSPRKLRLVADMVRKMKPAQALTTLEFTHKAAASPLAKAIKTALANAKSSDVEFKTLEVNEGMKLKRYRAGTAGRGRGRPYQRRWSQVRVVLTDEVQLKSQKVKVDKEVEVKELKAEAVNNEVAEKVEKEIEKKFENKKIEKGGQK